MIRVWVFRTSIWETKPNQLTASTLDCVGFDVPRVSCRVGLGNLERCCEILRFVTCLQGVDFDCAEVEVGCICAYVHVDLYPVALTWVLVASAPALIVI